MDDIDKTYAILKYDLAKNLPIRVVIKYDNGKLLGLTEESFSMSWSDRVINIFWSNQDDTYPINGIRWAEANTTSDSLVIDPLAADSPVEINWEAWNNATTKYSKRNAPFTLKEKK